MVDAAVAVVVDATSAAAGVISPEETAIAEATAVVVAVAATMTVIAAVGEGTLPADLHPGGPRREEDIPG